MFHKQKYKFLFIFGFVFFLCFILEAGCGPSVCTNGISTLKINPHEGICTENCDCNNQNYEGICLKGKCSSILRQACQVIGSTESCKPRLASVSCTEGLRVCQDTGLNVMKWGNCACPSSTEQTKEGFSPSERKPIESVTAKEFSKAPTELTKGNESPQAQEKPHFEAPRDQERAIADAGVKKDASTHPGKDEFRPDTGCLGKKITCGGSVCTDPKSDPLNCGKCGNKCPDGKSCTNGLCTECPSDRHSCNGTCVDTDNDKNHCGGCKRACKSGGACCTGACADLQTDPDNCGKCGNTCDMTCNKGMCSKWLKISKSGGARTCGLLDDGTVWCWGYNTRGILGQPKGTTFLRPTKIPSLSGVIDISLNNAGCALLKTGEVHCWGERHYKVASGLQSIPRHIPIKIQGVPIGGKQLSLAGTAACLLVRNGRVYCWGTGAHGQLGNGKAADSKVPVPVKGVTNAVSLVRSSDTSSTHCALLKGNTYECWGHFNTDLTGSGVRGVQSTPVSSKFKNVKYLDFTNSNAFVGFTDGSTKCIGSNSYGQCALGSTQNHVQNFTTTKLRDLVQVKISGDTFCAIMKDGTGRCWGNGQYGGLGDGTKTKVQPNPVKIKGLKNIKDLEIAETYQGSSCAILQDGSAWCWGGGYTGDGTSMERLTPVRVKR